MHNHMRRPFGEQRPSMYWSVAHRVRNDGAVKGICTDAAANDYRARAHLPVWVCDAQSLCGIVDILMCGEHGYEQGCCGQGFTGCMSRRVGRNPGK